LATCLSRLNAAAEAGETVDGRLRQGIYLEDLYVRDSARGLGVGRALVTRIAQLVVERGGKRLDLSVLTWNPAREVYERLGFDHKSDWTGYRLTGDALKALAEKG